jgi:hypothetical protein
VSALYSSPDRCQRTSGVFVASPRDRDFQGSRICTGREIKIMLGENMMGVDDDGGWRRIDGPWGCVV